MAVGRGCHFRPETNDFLRPTGSIRLMMVFVSSPRERVVVVIEALFVPAVPALKKLDAFTCLLRCWTNYLALVRSAILRYKPTSDYLQRCGRGGGWEEGREVE